MIPSSFQQKIYDEIRDGTGSLVIEAVAGSGKTTTIVEAAKSLKPGGTYVAISFNKAIAESLQSRMPYYVRSSTFHSLCFDALKQHLQRAEGGRRSPKVDANKTKWILKDDASVSDSESWELLPFVSKLVSFAKGETTKPEDVDFESIIEYHDLEEPDDLRRALRIARLVLLGSFDDRTRVDFDDMLWLTYQLNVPFAQRADVLFIDEAQDLNSVQIALLERILKPTSSEAAGEDADSEEPNYKDGVICPPRRLLPPSGRLIAVGDRHQAIYGFRGARSDGLDEIQKRFAAKTLPLSVSYRCSQAVVAEAQRALEGYTQPPLKLLGKMRVIDFEPEPDLFD